MKFKGNPFLTVIDSKTNKAIGIFDADGFLEVTNPKLIERMKRRYKAVEEKKEEKRVCRICGAECDGQGALMRHHKEAHPK